MSDVKMKITECYCINLRRAANSITSYYDSVMNPLGITITQFSLLSSIHKLNGCTVTDLAVHMGLERTTVVRNIKPLYTKELILNSARNGARKKCIVLTEKGSNVLNEGRKLWNGAQEEIAEIMGKDEMEILVSATRKLARLPLGGE